MPLSFFTDWLSWYKREKWENEMLIYSTGTERDHKVAVNPQLVVNITPQGENFARIYMVDGSKHLVDRPFNLIVSEIKAAQERAR